MKENLREAKKELFIARKNCILACTKAALIVTLAAFGPTTLVASAGVIVVNRMKEQTKEVPYIEEVLIDSEGTEKITEIQDEEKGDSFYKVYTDCSSLDGKYVASYELYTGDAITYDNLDLVYTYDVPAFKVFEYHVTGIETVEKPIEKGYSTARVYRLSEKTYERPIQEGDDEYTKIRIADVTKSVLIGSVSYFCLNNTFFKKNSVYDSLTDDIENEGYVYTVRNKKEKVKRLKKESKEE